MTMPLGPSGPLSERSSFRRFPVEYRRRIVAEYFGFAAYSQERGELLRREGLTTARLYEWARQASVKPDSSLPVAGVPRRQRAPKRTTEQVEIERLEREVKRLRVETERQKTVIDILGKTHALLEQLSESADTDAKSPR
jgi:transposase